jgi:TRAP-type mannitol/chloroaromatic compound transport system substrate-binding protein
VTYGRELLGAAGCALDGAVIIIPAELVRDLPGILRTGMAPCSSWLEQASPSQNASARREDIMHNWLAAGLATLLLSASSGIAGAQEVTLKGITSFAEKTLNSRSFERFIEIVNAEGKGKVRIDYIGGPKAMPPFEVGNALKSGVVDIANVTGAFYTNVFPESDAWKLTQRPMSELRKNGGFDYMAKLYDEKMNAIYLARQIGNTPFHVHI